MSVSGVEFARDSSIPFLGEAFRDPSGLIWGSPVTEADGRIKTMTQKDALAYCHSGGARLPTKSEFDQLAGHLGKGTANGYSPFVSGGWPQVLPGLFNYWFWSASIASHYTGYGYVFSGGKGYIGYYYEDMVFGIWLNFPVRCVAGP